MLLCRWVYLLFLCLVPAGGSAQEFDVGQTGWQLERLSDQFVLLRAEIFQEEAPGKRRRQGLLILTCDRQARRIRFQIGETPRQPSIQADQFGRVMVRGHRNSGSSPPPLNTRARFFSDGSFELLEAVGFSDPIMRDFVRILLRVPSYVDVILFKGPETGAFLRGTAMRFNAPQLEENLVQLYGFEGLCFRPRD